MRTALVIVAVLAVATLAPPASTQETFEVSVTDADGAGPPTNATLVFSGIDGSDPRVFETDIGGRAQVDVPAGDYRVRAFVPNETGELWFEQDLAIEPANGSITLARNLPSLGRRPGVAGAESSADGSTANVPIGSPLDLRIAVRYADSNRPRILLARILLTQGNATLQEGILGPTTFTAPGWINGTLAASSGSPYYQNESLTSLRVFLVENETHLLYDASDPVTVFFRDGCIGEAVQLRVTIDGTQVPFCAMAGQAAAWQSWADAANQLAAVQAAWWARFQANATKWTFEQAQANWTSYANETNPARTVVTKRLDEAQTDLSGFPTWQQLDGMRTLLLANHTKVQGTWERFAQDEHARRTTTATLVRAQTFGLIVLAAVVGAAAAFGGSVLIVRSWKRRAEYWMGYSGQDPGTSPLWFTFAMGAAVALVALLATFLTPLWRVLGGAG